jgi:prepilin-type processing-associated H-X9-DG protein
MHLARRTGQTLVELLVVIGLIALLIGALLLAIGNARAASQRTRCLANLRQFSVANQLYAVEFSRWTVPVFWGWSPANAPWPANTPPAIPPSGPRKEWVHVWQFGRALNARNPGSGRYPSDLLCPYAPLAWQSGNAQGYTLGNSYGMNRTQLPGMAAAGAPDYWNAWRATQVRKPSEKIQWVDAVSVTVAAGGKFNATMRYFVPGYGERHEAPDKTDIVAYRHLRGANALFHDGHAQWLPASELRYDPADKTTTVNKRQWEPKTP